MFYIKKPILVEAFQYDGDFINKKGKPYVPEWVMENLDNGVLFFGNLENNSPPCELFIKTLEGNMHVSVGDYIIKGVNEEVYPCIPDIFLKTYNLMS